MLGLASEAKAAEEKAARSANPPKKILGLGSEAKAARSANPPKEILGLGSWAKCF